MSSTEQNKHITIISEFKFFSDLEIFSSKYGSLSTCGLTTKHNDDCVAHAARWLVGHVDHDVTALVWAKGAAPP